MKYMLDTNICIYAIKKKPEKVVEHLEEKTPGEICISSVTYGELMHGVEKSQRKERNMLALLLLLSEIDIVDFDSEAAEHYGEIRATLERKGAPIGPMDSMIAGHARAKDCILVTNNTREFNRVKGLRLENWAQ